MRRRIPTIMFSQHPDHAAIPFWNTHAYIETHHEITECMLMFKHLADEEVMWDWEGKMVDEAVIEKLLTTHHAFFQKKHLGRDVFLTFRVPNPRIEMGYRLGRAFMVILSAKNTAEAHKFHTPPLFEIILPMTETADEMIELNRRFQLISEATNQAFGENNHNANLEIIPIFESVDAILSSGKTIEEYVTLYTELFHETPKYLRPFTARSDPALNSGIVPTTLAIKWALSEYARFSKKTGIPTYPIIAPGALPFRGFLRPDRVDEFLQEFKGVKTIVIQSAFRYDYPKDEVKKAIAKIKQQLPKLTPTILPPKTLSDIQKIIPLFEIPYKKTVEKLAPHINQVAAFIPKRRERLQHIGLFGYSRSMGEIKLPRAIGFAASCYSLGLPPELFGVGKGIEEAKKKNKLKLVEQLYVSLKPSLIAAGRYLRTESIQAFGLKELASEITIIEEYIGETLGPKTKEEFTHAALVEKIITKLKEGKNPTRDIEKAAILRKSLG